MDAQHAAVSPIGHARDHDVLRRHHDAALRAAKTHRRTGVVSVRKASAMNRDLSAGDRCTRLHALNVRDAVRIQPQIPHTFIGLNLWQSKFLWRRKRRQPNRPP